MKAKKAQPPSAASQRLPDRLQKIQASITQALVKNYLSPEEAQRLAGKIILLTTTMFGRLGQAPLRAIYSRSYAAHSSDDHRLTGALRASLSTMAKILQRLQARVVSFDVRC
ncbi:unnamed protein product [Effrenium voratum]|nr:unnamed protein product [Effrenium voratum]